MPRKVHGEIPSITQRRKLPSTESVEAKPLTAQRRCSCRMHRIKPGAKQSEHPCLPDMTMTSQETPSRSPMHQQQQSPLFRLPSELRNEIYERAFATRDGPVHMNNAAADFSTSGAGATGAAQEFTPSNLGRVTPTAPSAAILRSCRRIRKESRALFATASQAYWRNEFVISIRQSPENHAYINFSANVNIPNGYLARIRHFTFLVRHRGTAIRVTCLWSDTDGRWVLNAEHDGSFVGEDDEVTRAAIEDVEDSMRRSEAFTATSPMLTRHSEATQAQRPRLDRRILHDVLRPLIVEEMFVAGSHEHETQRPWRNERSA